MGVPLRVLLVEDYEDDALLLLSELRRGGYDPVYERVDTAGAMEAALDEREWDLVIADHSMPAFSSFAALELLRGKGFTDLPFIIVSGQIGERVAVEAMKAGAQDYLMKDNLVRLNTAIERELRDAEVRRERRRAEEALRVSEMRFRQMFEQAPIGISRGTPDGRWFQINRAGEEIWGVTLEEVMEYNPDYNVLEDEQLEAKGVTQYLRRGFAGEPTAIPPILYDPFATIGGRARWVRSFIYPVKDDGGEILEVILMQEDITEQREAEEERRLAEEKYRGIFENAVEGIFQTTVEGRFVTANPALARMFGYDSPEDLLERVSNIAEQLNVDPERRATFSRLVRRDGLVLGFEVQIRRKDGGTMWASTSARAIRDAGGALVGYEGTVEDITQRKRLEESLREIREAERRRIARELHDVVLQDLTYAMQSLRVTLKMPPEARPEEETGRQIEALKRAVGGLRGAIYDLRLESAQEQPLSRTLHALVELNRQMAPERALELVVDERFPASISGPASREVARIVQEALANVRRHSEAHRATVTLGTAGGEVLVEVEDDGRGFEPEEPAGMGLTGMRERASVLGGELEVEGERGAGTRVLLRVPLLVLADEDPEYQNAPK
jgi:two-component system, NarL family, sensor histidine kinase UhpB